MQKKKYALIAGLVGILGFGGGAVLGMNSTKQAVVVEVTPTVVIPTTTPTPYIQQRPKTSIQTSPYREVTATPIPIQRSESQLVDCYYKNDAGYLLYDFGKVSVEKCRDLQSDWWNRKQDQIDKSFEEINQTFDRIENGCVLYDSISGKYQTYYHLSKEECQAQQQGI